MKKDKKFIIGLILTIIGVIGFSGLPSSDGRLGLFMGSLIFVLPGVVLLYLARKAQYPEATKNMYEKTVTKKPLTKE
ncbi:MAG: hypothetical protein K2M82_04845 [Lachnospiraceae bacterium]|nr:hypothetical protein [Lachnospiraceae bacterium]